jgi:hypothetical protein
MYKLYKDWMTKEICCIVRLLDMAYIPMNPDNTDYQTFKKKVLAGAELQDAEGVVMTDASAFIQELP